MNEHQFLGDPPEFVLDEKLAREVRAATMFETELVAREPGPFTPYPRVLLRVMSDELRLREAVS